MQLDPSYDPTVYANRRDRLRSRLNDEISVLIPAGEELARNLPVGTFPWRANSHALYFVGRAAEPKSYLLIDAEATTLFVHRSPEQEFWHGPQMPLDELAERLGIHVQPVTGLEEALRKRNRVSVLPSLDFESRLRVSELPKCEVEYQQIVSELLGRAPRVLTEDDIAVADAVIEVRMRQDYAAKAGLLQAAEATIAAHKAGMAAARPGIREYVVRAALEAELIARGMGTAYQSIVTKRGQVLHNFEYVNEIENGDLILCDAGAETADGYACDVTRTFPVNGKFSTVQRTIYNIVLEAQRRAIAMVKPGVRYLDIHMETYKNLAEGLVQFGLLRGDAEELASDGVIAYLYPHGLGHMLALDVHDMEAMGNRAGFGERERSKEFGIKYLRLDRDLVTGMCITVEPGLYFAPGLLSSPDFKRKVGDRLNHDMAERLQVEVRGIRIEDAMFVTEKGAEVYTSKLPTDPDQVEMLVGRSAAM